MCYAGTAYAMGNIDIRLFEWEYEEEMRGLVDKSSYRPSYLRRDPQTTRELQVTNTGLMRCFEVTTLDFHGS
jgi:hypothetical protein